MNNKRTLENLLSAVDYSKINSYIPTEFSLKFLNFVKMVYGSSGSENKTPLAHLKMVDSYNNNSRVISLCHRGFAKTTVNQLVYYYCAFNNNFGNLNNVDAAIFMSDTAENGLKSFLRNFKLLYDKSLFLQKVLPTAKFTENFCDFVNINGEPFSMKLASVGSSLRGTNLNHKRPQLVILDDLMSDYNTKSATVIKDIEESIYDGLMGALHSQGNKVIWTGTPYNKNDPITKAVESGAWFTNIFPICETFPCTKEDFRGSWEDRFSFAYINETYNFYKLNNKLPSFYKEFMLQITSSEERIVQESDIIYYNKADLLANKQCYNFYITTDFATGEKKKNDFSVISVWAVDKHGTYHLVDGVCKKQVMADSFNDLFRLVDMYNPIEVGIETNGQQGGFISLLFEQMDHRRKHFAISRKKGSKDFGIRNEGDKLSRFTQMSFWFNLHRIKFPSDNDSFFLNEFLSQLRLTTFSGFKGKDDCIDTVSMLQYINIILPSSASNTSVNSKQEYGFNPYSHKDDYRLSSRYSNFEETNTNPFIV